MAAIERTWVPATPDPDDAQHALADMPEPVDPSEALFWAIEHGLPDLVRELLLEGANVAHRMRGETALHLAAFLGERDAIRWLLAGGADVNAPDDDGHTPLSRAMCGLEDTWLMGPFPPRHVASTATMRGVVRQLLRRGADPTLAPTIDHSPLWHACDLLEHQLLRNMLRALGPRARAAVNQQEADGRTVMHAALGAESPECLQLLVHAGADLRAIADPLTRFAQEFCGPSTQRLLSQLLSEASRTQPQPAAALAPPCKRPRYDAPPPGA